GLVPIQSALFLDISTATVFSQIDNQKRVSLSQISVAPNCGSQGPVPLGAASYRVWWGSRDQLQDRLALLETANPCYWRALALDISSAVPSVPTLTLQFGYPASAGISAATIGDGATAATGYVRIQPATGSRAASGFAIYGLRVGGVLVSETAVLASAALQRGGIYSETAYATRTGVAKANPNAQ